jgi:hypothetical protein
MVEPMKTKAKGKKPKETQIINTATIEPFRDYDPETANNTATAVTTVK